MWMVVAGRPTLVLPDGWVGRWTPAVLAGVTGLLVAGPIVGLLGVITTGAVATGVRRMSIVRVGKELADRWPDFLSHVRSRLGTGEPLTDAVRHASRAVGGPFDVLDRAYAGDFEEALVAAQAEWADPVADRVLTTLRFAGRVGGERVDALVATLTQSVAEEIRLRRVHHSHVAQQRMTVLVALVAPWSILGLSILTNPQAAEVFATTTGRNIIVGGLVATVGGYLTARRALALARQPRIFT
jgi:Flp pilus assembly protein TadB